MNIIHSNSYHGLLTDTAEQSQSMLRTNLKFLQQPNDFYLHGNLPIALDPYSGAALMSASIKNDDVKKGIAGVLAIAFSVFAFLKIPKYAKLHLKFDKKIKMLNQSIKKISASCPSAYNNISSLAVDVLRREIKTFEKFKLIVDCRLAGHILLVAAGIAVAAAVIFSSGIVLGLGLASLIAGSLILAIRRFFRDEKESEACFDQLDEVNRNWNTIKNLLVLPLDQSLIPPTRASQNGSQDSTYADCSKVTPYPII